jgi:hypothetical protein
MLATQGFRLETEIASMRWTRKMTKITGTMLISQSEVLGTGCTYHRTAVALPEAFWRKLIKPIQPDAGFDLEWREFFHPNCTMTGSSDRRAKRTEIPSLTWTPSGRKCFMTVLPVPAIVLIVSVYR